MASTDTSADPQESEIETLKEEFPGQVRVIRNLGEFSHVVNVHPEGLDMNIKFQLTETYPKTPPNVFVKLGNKADGSEDLANQLSQKARGCIGSPMIAKLIQLAINQVDVMGLDVQKQDKMLNRQKQRGKKKSRSKKKNEEEDADEKKVSMKTAGDVISRIMWDETLPSDQFTVGYMDRFIGMVEKNFSAFSWEDLASVDYTVLAIPKHRIHYFKYKDVKVWDKDKRMDNVFGSTGSKLTILDVMAQCEADREVEREQWEGRVSGAVHTSDHADSDDSDDDSDDGIQITIGAIEGPFLDEVQDHEETDEMSKAYAKMGGAEFWEDKLRPNYFLAVRVTDKELVQNVEHVRNAILEAEPRYKDCCIPNCSLHITLCVIRLDTPENVANAVQILQKAKSELSKIAPKGKALRLEGVSNFYDRVIYAKVHYPPEFLEFVDHLKMCLWEGGVSNKDGYEFVPHMTIMKVSRPVSRLIGTSKVNPRISAAHADKYFGTQSIDGVQLCAMGDERREDGFYVTPVSIDFGTPETSADSSADADENTLSDTELDEYQVPAVSRALEKSSISDKVRSNFFLTVKISDPNVVKNVDLFQQQFMSREPIFQDFCIPPNDLHITFGTLYLETQGQVTRASEILSDAQPDLLKIFPKDQSIQIEGVGVFFNRVIYAKVNAPRNFLTFLRSAVHCLVQEGIEIREKENYVPHLTLVRVSQQDARVRKLKKIEKEMVQSWAKMDFGLQSSISIHLCPVGKMSRITSSTDGH